MRRKRILIVDDNEVILRSLSLKLKASDYDVITATDGSDAVTTVRTQVPDLILLDLGFPPEVSGVAWDGFVIIQWLRRIEEAKNTPIIVITISDPAKFRDRALAAGAVAFFQKPINNEELLAAVRRALNDNTPVPKET